MKLLYVTLFIVTISGLRMCWEVCGFNELGSRMFPDMNTE